LTSGWRAGLGSCSYSIRPSASAAYNPLLEIRKGDCEVRDAQNIADILVDPEGALERRNHWEKTSHSLLVARSCMSLRRGRQNARRRRELPVRSITPDRSDPKRDLATPHLGERAHPVVASSARELLNKSENERSGVLSTTMSFLGLYRDPVVAKVTGGVTGVSVTWSTGLDPYHCIWWYRPPTLPAQTVDAPLLNQIGRRLTESWIPTGAAKAPADAR